MAPLYFEFMLKLNCFFLRIGLLFLTSFFTAHVVLAQNTNVTISGVVKDSSLKSAIAFVNVVLKTEKDTAFIAGVLTNEEGRFTLLNIKPGNYFIEVTYIGYVSKLQTRYVGSLSEYLDLGIIEMVQTRNVINGIKFTGASSDNIKLDKKVFTTSDNISQSGGSVLQTMQNLPGVTIQDGKILLRGNDKVIILIDGKQTALTGFGNQTGLDNIPASSIERIEIINNPSSKFDANGNAGIINIIYKKNKKDGFNGKVGLATGLGALWVRKDNLPSIRPQYIRTPKINPSISLNYRKGKINLFFQGDYLYTHTLNKNEFVTRNYDSAASVNQQTKRNRNTGFITTKAGIDWNIDERNLLTVSGLYGREKILDNGDQPFFNADLSSRLRLWEFLEDELKTTVMATAAYQHKYKQPGKLLNIGFNYTFHREDEKYFFNNILPTYSGKDAFKLISDEQVADFNLDYIKPLKYGRFESGFKFRKRGIPTNMQFIPGYKSPLDTNAGGWATYKEIIPALYGIYIFENKKIESEIGLRLEYVNLHYNVNPEHITYKSSGYNYTQPFPSIRLAYKLNDKRKISLYYNRRVDRPNEVDIRIFPKYDDAEIIKVGNPALRPQFTNSLELGFKTNAKKSYFNTSVYHRMANGTITRIASTVGSSNLIYSIFQNVNKSFNTGCEMVYSLDVAKWYSFNLNVNVYRNQINAFTVVNKYPITHTFSAAKAEMISGNLKLNNKFRLPKKYEAQVTATYLAPDIVPQGKINARFSVDLGIRRTIQNGKGEVFLNATDLFNTLVIKREIQGSGFSYISTDYYETQVVRIGYAYKF